MGISSKTFHALSDLPEKISGDGIDLLVTSAALWPYIEKMEEAHLRVVLKQLSMSEKWIPFFKDKEQFDEVISSVSSRETNPEKTYNEHLKIYWIIDKAENSIAGYRHAVLHKNNAISFGSFVLSDFRRRGFSTLAASAIADELFKFGNISCICAETYVDNVFAQRALIKAGFVDCGVGLCSTYPGAYPGLSRRYMKYREQAAMPAWPFPSQD